jgi:hypothetical protein
MQVHELQYLKSEARQIARIFVIGEVEAIKIAIELRKLESLQEISYFLRKDGEFQESMSLIANSIIDKQ